jgi:hypothetical protein
MDSGGFSAAWCWVVRLVVVLLPPPPPALLATPTKAEERSVSDDKLTRRNSASDDKDDRATIVIDRCREAGNGIVESMECNGNLLFFGAMVVHQTPSFFANLVFSNPRLKV